jgi:2-methylaconitate cis-trans-isomerase PrpF
MSQQTSYRYTLMRGGTSKAFFFKWNELPPDKMEREKTILAIFGSPDMRQIDGLGGAWEGYSKVAIIGPPSIHGADVDYTFGQVQINRSFIDWNFNCGNISAAVGPYAIDEGMVRVTEPITRVRIHMTNFHQVITADVPVKNGNSLIYGEYTVAGVPGTGARIDVNNSGLVGTSSGKLLPTGNVMDELHVEELGKVPVSIVDIANPFVFIHADVVGATGKESRPEIERNKELLGKLVAIRCAAAERLGFVADRRDATEKSPSRPCLAYVHEAIDYPDYVTGEIIQARDTDFLARNIFNNTAHETFMGTGSICITVAAMIEGTVVNKVVSERAKNTGIVRFGHPRGIIETVIEVSKNGAEYVVKKASMGRTARRLADGLVYVRKDI